MKYWLVLLCESKLSYSSLWLFRVYHGDWIQNICLSLKKKRRLFNTSFKKVDLTYSLTYDLYMIKRSSIQMRARLSEHRHMLLLILPLPLLSLLLACISFPRNRLHNHSLVGRFSCMNWYYKRRDDNLKCRRDIMNSMQRLIV